MTPKEKAKELLEKFEDIKTLHFWAEYENNNILLINQAKICALIAVDEILKTIGDKIFSEYEYWQEVKQEIELL